MSYFVTDTRDGKGICEFLGEDYLFDENGDGYCTKKEQIKTELKETTLILQPKEDNMFEILITSSGAWLAVTIMVVVINKLILPRLNIRWAFIILQLFFEKSYYVFITS